MKLRLLSASVLAMTLAAGTAAAQTSTAPASTPAPDRNALSYALGYDLGRNLIESGESVDLATVQKALNEGYAKKEPSVPVDQLRTAVQQMEARQMAKAKAAFDQAAAANKTKSDAFLAQNKTKAGVQTLPGGVQYRVVEAGSGAKPTQSSTVSGSRIAASGLADSSACSDGARRDTCRPPGRVPVSRMPRLTQSCIACHSSRRPSRISSGLRQACSLANISAAMLMPSRWAVPISSSPELNG